MYSSSLCFSHCSNQCNEKNIIKAKFDQRKYSRTKLNSSVNDTLQWHQEGINVCLYLGLIWNKLKSVELNEIFFLSVTLQRILKIDKKRWETFKNSYRNNTKVLARLQWYQWFWQTKFEISSDLVPNTEIFFKKMTIFHFNTITLAVTDLEWYSKFCSPTTQSKPS